MVKNINISDIIQSEDNLLHINKLRNTLDVKQHQINIYRYFLTSNYL